jgi:N-acetylmuramoyl-L-alanine amidase
MTRFNFISIFIFLTALMLAFAGTAQAAVTILGLRGGIQGENKRLVIDVQGQPHFQASTINQPPQLVVDIPAIPLSVETPQKLGPTGIQSIAQEQRGDQLRLIFKMPQSVTIVSSFLLPADGKSPARIVIDYRQGINDPNPTKQGKENLSFSKEDRGPKILGQITYPARKPAVPASGFIQDLDLGGGSTRKQIKADQLEKSDGAAANPSFEVDKAPPVPKGDKTVFTIVIDAGHGGKDPGAIGVGEIKEKDITLAAAQELERQLQDLGRFKVYLTRRDDRFILLPERVRIARSQNADLFISLHADMAADGAHTDGLSIYTLSDTASDAQTEKLAAQENKVDLLAGVDLSGAQEDVASILIDLAMRENMNQSRFFAGKVVKSMQKGGISLLPKPQRYAGFAVLKAADIPSVLIEMGFLSNPAEARRLQDGAHRRRLMKNLTQGILQYFDYIEKNRQM